MSVRIGLLSVAGSPEGSSAGTTRCPPMIMSAPALVRGPHGGGGRRRRRRRPDHGAPLYRVGADAGRGPERGGVGAQPLLPGVRDPGDAGVAVGGGVAV